MGDHTQHAIPTRRSVSSLVPTKRQSPDDKRPSLNCGSPPHEMPKTPTMNASKMITTRQFHLEQQCHVEVRSKESRCYTETPPQPVFVDYCCSRWRQTEHQYVAEFLGASQAWNQTLRVVCRNALACGFTGRGHCLAWHSLAATLSCRFASALVAERRR